MKPKKHRWGLIICAVAFVLMLFYLFIGGEAQMLVEALKSFKIEYLFIIFLLMIVNWGMEAISIHWLTKQVHSAQRFRHTCTTTMIVTMNARSLHNFFKLRCCSRAQWEIRELACQMLALVKEVAPNTFKNAGPDCVRGAFSEGAMTCGKAKEMRQKFKGE